MSGVPGQQESTSGITALLVLRVLINKLVCDLDVELGHILGQSLRNEVCSTDPPLHDLSSNRREPGWFLSSGLFILF